MVLRGGAEQEPFQGLGLSVSTREMALWEDLYNLASIRAPNLGALDI